ncbi:MAG TPA: methylmalonyl Co-A mutase-associated GTPase MeaB [Gemmatimonadales bacterium]|nr:methylmalonyl Co-A mutase-associated GTPase MeaB [Gemmatimonadales bacterium]
MSLERILEGLGKREPAALARAITLVENQREGFERVLSHAHGLLGRGGARRIGITGPPGAGKSTLTEALIQRFRAQELSVGVVAVDPTSPFTGGALLGDRIRMESVSLDPHVFIRSMATRGAHGGLATTTEEVADLLEAFGFQRMIVETVGVGQTELDIARTAETTVLVLVPESGDGIQTLKAGVMEIADLYVVNKSDRLGADKLRQEVEVMLGIRRGNAFRHVAPHHRSDARTAGQPDRTRLQSAGPAVRPSDSWEPPVLGTVASTGQGVDELAAALDRHHAYLEASGQLVERRRRRLAARTRAVLERGVQRWLVEATHAEELLRQRLDEVADGRRSPYDVAAEILDQVKTGVAR